MKKELIFVLIIVVLVLFTIFYINGFFRGDGYPVHRDITVTYFWVGEGASEDNLYISNSASAWNENWIGDFGGIDNPENRNGYIPANFVPNENSFYFALPYNDLDNNGERKENARKVYWFDERDWTEGESMLKNKWIRIIKDGREAYAQWEDVGPFGEDDVNYVFGDKSPKNLINENVGIDVSPAVRDYLNLDGIDKVDWQFVDFEDVPEGPWKERITS